MKRVPLVKDVWARPRKGKFTVRHVDPDSIEKCPCGVRGKPVSIEGKTEWRCNSHLPRRHRYHNRHNDSLQERRFMRESPTLFGPTHERMRLA